MKKAVFAALAVVLCAGGLVAYNMYGGAGDGDNRIRGVVLEGATSPTNDTRVASRETAAASSVRAQLPEVPAMRPGNRLVIGRISTNVRKHWPRLEAMANYLTTELASVGVAGVDIKMVDTLEEMRELFRTGQVDILSETAFGAIELTQNGSAEMLMREWKSGVSSYHTVIFARRDSGIRGLDDLVGRNFVFEDRTSTSAYLMPRAAMAREGYDLVELDDPLARPPQGSIGFAFAEDESTVVSRVRRGFADAGAVSNLDWSDEDEVSAEEKADLVAIYETEPVIRSIVLVRSSLDPAVKTRLATVLEHMHESTGGMETLREYWKTAQFDRIEGAALEGLLSARVLHETFRSF